MAWEQTARDIEYNANVEMELQQEPGILYQLAAIKKNGAGATEVNVTDRFGQMAMQKKTTTNGDTNYTDGDLTRRFAKKPGSSNVATLIDRDAVNSTSVEPKAPLIMATANAARAYHDDVFLSGWWGTGWEGEESAETAIPFPSANKIAGGVTGLTKAKLIRARMLLGQNHVSVKKEKPIILLDASAEADLLSIEEYVNLDYGKGATLEDGELKPWLGFRFLQAELGDPIAYPTAAPLFNSGGFNRLPIIVPSGVARVTWVEFFGKAGTPMPDKQWSEQIYAEAESAVVRTDEKKAWFIEAVPQA
jgi:hypothetical protein